MPAFYTREKSKYGGIVGTIQAYTTTLSQSNNPEDFISKLPAGYLRCDGSILDAGQYPLLAAILGTGSQSKFARDPDSLAQNEFQLPDLGSKYIRAANSSGGYLNDEVGNTGQYRAGVELDADVLGSTTKTVTYNGNFKVLSENSIPFDGTPLYTAGDDEFQSKNGLATADTFQAHGHDISRRAILTYTGSWQDSPAAPGGFGFNYVQVQGSNALQAIAAPEGTSFLAGQHKHQIDVPKSATFKENTNFVYNMALQEIDPFGLETTVNLSTTTLNKLDDAVSPYILVEYIIKF